MLAVQLLAAFVLVEGVLLGLGLLVIRVLAHSSLHQEEVAFEAAVLAHRTPLLDQVSRYAGLLGATPTVVALTAVGCLLLGLRGHGPRLPMFLAVAVAGETILFLLASGVLDRVRPGSPSWTSRRRPRAFPPGTPRRASRCGADWLSGWRGPTLDTRSGCSAGCSPWCCRLS